jgi:hypothetical protein
MRYLPLLLSVVAFSGCASRPAGVPAQPPAAQPSAAQPPAAQSAPGTAQTSATDAPAGNPDLIKQGYRVAMRRGEVVYCRKDMLTGTRFPSEVCLTEFQIKDISQRAKDSLTIPHSCSSTGC